MKRFITVLLVVSFAVAAFGENMEALRKCAEGGDAKAQFNLGNRYEQGQGVAQDFKEAVKWYLKAAEQGEAGAQGGLGSMYDRGLGVPQDHKEAAKWSLKAAEQGHAGSQFRIAIRYKTGQGVDQDDMKANMWVILACSGGDRDAAVARDDVAQDLTPEQLAKAQDLARAKAAEIQKRMAEKQK